jgi:hypothetical protein
MPESITNIENPPAIGRNHSSSMNLLRRLPIQPISPPVPFSVRSFVPWCLGGFASIMQNKPNSQNPKTTATSYATKSYTNILPPSTLRKRTQTNPILSRQCLQRTQKRPNHAIHDMLHAVRSTLCETNPTCRAKTSRSRIPPPGIKHPASRIWHLPPQYPCRTQLSK